MVVNLAAATLLKCKDVKMLHVLVKTAQRIANGASGCNGELATNAAASGNEVGRSRSCPDLWVHHVLLVLRRKQRNARGSATSRYIVFGAVGKMTGLVR